MTILFSMDVIGKSEKSAFEIEGMLDAGVLECSYAGEVVEDERD